MSSFNEIVSVISNPFLKPIAVITDKDISMDTERYQWTEQQTVVLRSTAAINATNSAVLYSCI